MLRNLKQQIDFNFNFRTLLPCPQSIRVCLPSGDFRNPIDLHLRMFVEHKEKLIFDLITEHICPDAAHPLALPPQVPDLEAPGGGGQEGPGVPQHREAADGPGNGQDPETLTTQQAPEGQAPRWDRLAGRHWQAQHLVILWKMTMCSFFVTHTWCLWPIYAPRTQCCLCTRSLTRLTTLFLGSNMRTRAVYLVSPGNTIRLLTTCR